jgi:phage/plasmid-like protein (TIGR03299 family)
MDGITIRNNKAEMAYVGQKPWHGLGQELQAGATIDEWKVQAGMDWKIKRSMVRYMSEGSQVHTMEHSHVLFRSDTKDHLGIVSSKYKVVQPGQVLEFFRDLTDENGYTLNTAGTLFGGRKFWALASVGEEAVVAGNDKIGGFLLLSSSCDGSLATSARFTTIRVVCNNTLSMAINHKDKKEISINHRSDFNSLWVKNQLGIATGKFDVFLKAARQLANKPVSEHAAGAFIESLLVENKIVLSKEKAVSESKPYKMILDLFNGKGVGSTMDGASGTAWGLLNAVTEYVDHHARAQTDSNRLASAWFGRGDELKTEAMEKALSI